MHAFGFKQHVTSPTHKCGHILDLVYSEVNLELNLHNWKVHEFISDHALVTIDTSLNKVQWETTEKIIRDTTKLPKETLEKFYTAPVSDGNASLKQACDQFNEELHKMLNRAVPPQRYDMQTGKKCHGTTGISMNRRELLKTGMKSTKSTEKITTGGPTPLKETSAIDYCNSTKKNQIISKQIMENSKNTKELFKIVNNLTGCNTHNPLPPGKTSEEIAEGFAKFFSNKITKI